MVSHRGLAIVNAYVTWPSVAHFLGRMKEELAALGVALEQKTCADIFTFIDENGNLHKEDLPYDFILFLDKDRYISTMLENAGYRLFNKASPIEICDDKMRTYIALANQGIPMPKTISAPLRYIKENNENFLQNLVQILSFPMVMKTNFGSMGLGVYLINDYEGLREKENAFGMSPHLYQQFIVPSKGFDYRLVLVNQKFVAGYRRRSLNGDFRSNIAQGGTGEKVDISPAMIDLAEKAASIIGLDYCGVDILDSGDPNRPILCEVNSNAFIEGAEKVTGINIAKAYAEHIQKEIYLK